MEPGLGHTRTLRLFAAAAALLVLLAVVAFASHSGFGRTSSAAPTPGYVNWAMSVFMILFVLMIPVAVYSYSVQMREFKVQNKRRSSMQSRIARSLIVILVICGLLALRQFAKDNGLFPTFDAPWLHHGKGRGADAVGGTHADPTFQWPVLWASLLLFAVVGAWWWTVLRKRSGVPVETASPSIEEDVVATIADAIDDLEAEPDARRAVIAAYARMEAVLGRHGLRRAPSETAVEYLRRILLGLTSRSDAVTRLTSLFERAKFSTHEIDASMKNDAITALRTIRDDLQGAAA